MCRRDEQLELRRCGGKVLSDVGVEATATLLEAGRWRLTDRDERQTMMRLGLGLYDFALAVGGVVNWAARQNAFQGGQRVDGRAANRGLDWWRRVRGARERAVATLVWART